jgi:hypothetical protein
MFTPVGPFGVGSGSASVARHHHWYGGIIGMAAEAGSQLSALGGDARGDEGMDHGSRSHGEL